MFRLKRWTAEVRRTTVCADSCCRSYERARKASVEAKTNQHLAGRPHRLSLDFLPTIDSDHQFVLHAGGRVR
jgi:hypothetical protein